jgi:signal transduction histidine kinase
VPEVDYTSRERLAASIEMLLREVIPRPTRGDDLGASIDAALRDESCRNERTVAYLRLAATIALPLLFALAGGMDTLRSPGPRLLTVLLWLGASVAVTIALRRGWYKPWIRRALPLADALMIMLAGTALTRDPPWAGDQTAGFAALSGLGVLLAISGALRLTRSSVYYSTVLAVVAIGVVSAWLGTPLPVAAIAIVPVLLAGVLALAVTQLARRLITTQVGQSAMRKLYGEAREVIDAREEVLRIVAHDLRNPLNTVAMTTQLLLELDSAKEQRDDRLRVIQRAGQRMHRLINDLLSVSIIEAGRLTIEPRPSSVAAILTDAAEMLRPIAADKSIFLETSAPAELPDVHADAARILQVLSNLVGNAIKFTPKGGRVTIAATREGSKVRFDVADTGSGIAPDQLANIFGRFWQANRADSRGIGLGLSIAKGIVEAHGEELSVESTLGKGSKFSFWLRAVEGGTPAVRT